MDVSSWLSCRHSGEIERLAVQVLGSLQLDEDAEPSLVGVALLLGLHEASPDLLVRAPGPVNRRGAVEAGDSPLGQDPGLTELGLPQEHGHLGAVLEVGVRRALAAL